MTDIVERLREKRGILDNRWPGPSQLELEAAAEIERLRAERLKLDRRIHNQRIALRQNWEIFEMRRNYMGSPASRGAFARLLQRFKALRQTTAETQSP